MKKSGIFVKVFTYTTIFLIVIVCVTVALFSQQFMSFYETNQKQQLMNSYQNLTNQLSGQSEENVQIIAKSFYENNQSFLFYITDSDNNIVFASPNIDTAGTVNGAFNTVVTSKNMNYTLYAESNVALISDYSGLILKILIALLVMFSLSIVGALIFARQMTKPILHLADDTQKMSNLELVLAVPERRDEIAALTRDVHSMYHKLRETISQLENEILRVREMEETQRYFFTAASHELKTPIAATSVLLEGMLENIGDYHDHPKYLRECIKMVDVQGKIISEILEIVNLNDGKITPNPEKLNLRATALDILPTFQTLAEAGKQSIILNIACDQTCLADKKMLQKVLSNIILNAIQNTPTGGEIRIWTERDGGYYRLCVLNTGTHIDEEVLPKLFDPFYRVDKARNIKSGRSGLGLTIVQKTLCVMGITFAISNVPEGVLFRIDLPIL